jgi:hypothetical protein
MEVIFRFSTEVHGNLHHFHKKQGRGLKIKPLKVLSSKMDLAESWFI